MTGRVLSAASGNFLGGSKTGRYSRLKAVRPYGIVDTLIKVIQIADGKIEITWNI